MNSTVNKALLVILDGWGLGPIAERSAIAKGHTACFDECMNKHPNSTLVTHGMEVGLPDGQMGNSEVGHLNIGAGRVVYQELARINKAIQENTLIDQSAIQELLERCKQGNKRVHLMGLYSDGGVHSHTAHFKALIDIFEQNTDSAVFIHTFLDGRDTDPQSGVGYIKDLADFLTNRRAVHASVIGRYYAMDRDKRWERIQLAYDLLTKGTGISYQDLANGIEESYSNGTTDEFMPGLKKEGVDGRVKEGDEVVFVNFRTDRPRQLVEVLTEYPQLDMQPLDITMTTMTQYDRRFEKCHVVFQKENVDNTIGEHLSNLGLTQLRAAETEKYAHVTYFLNGGREEVFPGEERVLVPSPKVATYDLQPEMSAIPLTDAVIAHMQEHQPHFICLNYANTDMVGHTGVFEAAVAAAEAVDNCLSRLLAIAEELDYRVIIIADHGNSDYMINDDGSPHTAHTMNPVPCIVIGPDIEEVKNGALCDVAPTILNLMGVPKHERMTGNTLIS